MRSVFLTFAILILVAVSAKASTFVGNGGNAGDVELLATVRQLVMTVSSMDSSVEKVEPIQCKCSEEFGNHPTCESLTALTLEQAKFCADFLTEKVSELKNLLDPFDQTRVTWAHEEMTVVENNQHRAVEAVANPQTGQLTINQEMFTEMRRFERLFLLTHEMLHFTKHQGDYLSDEGTIGPFTGADGSRRLLNAMASATVMRALDSGFLDYYGASLNRSRSWKKTWVDINGGSTTPTVEGSGTYASKRLAQTQMGLRYYWKQLGMIFNYRYQRATKTVLTSVQTNEKVESVGAGLTYRIFPFRDPLTFSGQSYIAFHALAEKFRATIKIHDPLVGSEDATDGWGGSLGTTYYLPIIWGGWCHLGASYDHRSYQYPDSRLRLKYGDRNISTYLGFSYGF